MRFRQRVAGGVQRHRHRPSSARDLGLDEPVIIESMHIVLTRVAAVDAVRGPAGGSRAGLRVGLRSALVHHGPRHRAAAGADAAAVREAPRAGGAAVDRSRHLAQRRTSRRSTRIISWTSTGRATARIPTASCRATSRPRWPSSGATASTQNGHAAVAHRGDVRQPQARVREPGPARRVRPVRRDVLFRVAGALRVATPTSRFTRSCNYDGQLTRQWGIHTRYEAILFERFNQQLTVAPKPQAPIANPRDFIFERVLEGTRLVPAILAADLAAIGDRDVYDDAYYAAFFKASRPVYERRLAESISAVAAMIAGAWEAAGKPPLPASPVRQPAAPAPVVRVPVQRDHPAAVARRAHAGAPTTLDVYVIPFPRDRYELFCERQSDEEAEATAPGAQSGWWGAADRSLRRHAAGGRGSRGQPGSGAEAAERVVGAHAGLPAVVGGRARRRAAAAVAAARARPRWWPAIPTTSAST